MPRCIAAAFAVGTLVLSAAADGDLVGLPNCTFDACEQCLAEAKSERANLTIVGVSGELYTSALRIGRSDEYWDSQALVAQIVGLVASEKLGVNVEYLNCDDETACTFAATNCVGWQNYACGQAYTAAEAEAAAAEGLKVFDDELADIMFFSETYGEYLDREAFASTELVFESRQVVTLGNAGYLVRDGVFTFAAVVQGSGEHLAWFPALAEPAARAALAPPQQLMDDGVEAEEPGCTSDRDFINASMTTHLDLGWTCVDSWWVNPACAGLGDAWRSQCVVVLEDDWGYSKPWLYKALVRSQVPVAKLMVGYDPWWELVYYRTYDLMFTWWKPDASILAADPHRVQLEDVDDDIPFPATKVGWGPALQADARVRHLLAAAAVDQGQIEELMRKVALAYEDGQSAGENAEAFYQKLACDWLRGNEATWSRWLMSERSCERGQAFEPQLERCEPCPLGTFQNASGESTCIDCTRGRSQAEPGQSHCESCPPGRAASDDGSSGCWACAKGMFAPGGSWQCEVCEIGRFAGELGTGACASCPEGECLPDTFTASDGCHPCSEVKSYEVALSVFGGIALIVAPGILAVSVNRDRHFQSNRVLDLAVICSIGITTMQAFGVFSAMAIGWFEPVASFLKACGIVSLELEALKIQCMAHFDPVTSHVFGLLPLAICGASALVAMVAKKVARPGTDLPAEYCNATGTLCNIFFISMVLSSLKPLICYTHPEGGGASMRSRPSVLCFETAAHGAMLAIGLAVFIAVIVPFIAFSAWMTVRFPTVIAKSNSPRLQKATRFLFIKFKPARYYYGIVLLAKSLCICLVPVAFPESAAMQCVFLGAILSSTIQLQQALYPWHSSLNNIIDGVISSLILMLLLCGSMAADFSRDMPQLKAMGSAAFVLVFVSLLCVLLRMILRAVIKRRAYDWFICHHKDDGCAQAGGSRASPHTDEVWMTHMLKNKHSSFAASAALPPQEAPDVPK